MDEPRSMWSERPDYRVDLLARRNRVTAALGDSVLADSEASLIVDEQDHGLVVYFPRDDVRMDLLTPTEHTSVCPFKGVASYWSAEGEDGANVAWSYEQPFPPVARLAGYIGFYQDRVRIAIGQAHPAVIGHER